MDDEAHRAKQLVPSEHLLQGKRSGSNDRKKEDRLAADHSLFAIELYRSFNGL